MFKFFVLCGALAAVNGGFLTGQHSVEVTSPSLTSQPSSILRNPGNVAQLSSYHKTIDSPYTSSQSKSDVRINSPGVYAHEGPIIYNSHSHSHSHGIPPSGFGRGDIAQYSARPSVSHVTYNAGPVAYATAPTLGQDTSYRPSYTDHTVGSSRENTVQSLNGNHAVSHYSKAVDTAFSSIRKSDPRGASEEKIVSVAPSAATALTYATASTYASPLVTKVTPTVSYSSAPVVAHASFSGLGTQYEW